MLHVIFQKHGIYPDEFIKFPEWKRKWLLESTKYQMELDAKQQVLGSSDNNDED